MKISNIEVKEGIGPTYIDYSEFRSIGRPPDFVHVTCIEPNNGCFVEIPTVFPAPIYISVRYGCAWKAMLIWLNE